MNYNTAYIIYHRETTLKTLEKGVFISQEDRITIGKYQH